MLNLRTKALLIFSASLFAISTLLYFLCQRVVLDGFLSLEQQRTEVNLSTVYNAFLSQLEDMDKTAADWGHWDDAYLYVQNHNSAFAKSNLAAEQLKTINLDTLLIIDRNGAIVAARSTVKPWDQRNEAPPEIVKAIQSTKGLTSFSKLDGKLFGVLPFKGGLMLVAARPITRSDGSGPIRGAIVMGRRLTHQEFSEIGLSTHSTLQVVPFSSPQGSDFIVAKQQAKDGKRTTVLERGEKWISGYAVINDVNGKPVLIMRATYPRTILWEGQASVRILLIALAISSFVFLCVSLHLLDRFVLRRIIRLEGEVTEIERLGPGKAVVDAQGGDEISMLGVSINQMLAALYESHQKVLESESALRQVNEELATQQESLETQNQELARVQDIMEARNQQLEENEAKLRTALSEAERARGLYGVASKRFQDLFERLPVPCLSLDQSGKVLEFNKASEDLLNMTREAIYGKPISDVIPAIKEMVETVMKGEGTFENQQMQCSRPDGYEMWLLANVFPLNGPDGSVVGALCACIDVTEKQKQHEQIESQLLEISESHVLLAAHQTELEEANARLESLATTDGLTELHNHRAFQEVLEREFQAARRFGTPVSVLLMDVDFFKQYNDTFGHLAGDEVLRKLATTLVGVARSTDFVARYGGEEFVVVLTGAEEKGALDAAERYRAAVEGQHWPSRAVTVSIGVATINGNTKSRTELLTNADRALYESKRLGRNRVTHAGDIERKAA